MTQTRTGPDWVGDGARQALEELRSFFATGYAFARHPAAFTEAWYRGERRAMSPLGCLGFAAALVGVPTDRVVARFLPQEGSSSLLLQAASAAGPYLHYAALGVLAHALLRVMGSSPSLQGSVGVALFAGSLPGAVASLLAALLLVVVGTKEQPGFAPGAAVALALVVLAAYGVFLGTMTLGLARLHAVPRWRATLGVAVAWVGTGLVFGMVPARVAQQVHFGLHLVIKVWGPGGLHDGGVGIVLP